MEENNNNQQLAKKNGQELAAEDILENAFANLTDDQVNAFSEKAADEALRLKVKERDQNLDMGTAKRETLDHIDAWNELHKDGRTMRHSMSTDMKTGSGNRNITSKTGATCFVATAAFGDEAHPTVESLRCFRDETLSKSTAGLRFIDWYYKNGSRLAEKLEKNSFLKPVVRLLLGIIVRLTFSSKK